MKRFFLKSVAYLSIAFLLAVSLPNINQATAATTTDTTIPDFSKKIDTPTVGPTVQAAAQQNNTVDNTPFVKYENSGVNSVPTSASTVGVTASTTSRTSTTTSATGVRGTTTQTVSKQIGSVPNDDPRFTDQDVKTIAAFQKLIDDPNTPADKRAQYEKSLASYKENAIASTEANSAMELGGKPVSGVVPRLIVSGVNWILFQIQAFLGWILGVAGMAIDSVMGMTMEIASNQKLLDIVKNSWVILRDTFNVFFIFLLLYISIKTILKGAAAKTKEMLANIVIAALLINFSLLITNAIIDASNIFTAALYNTGQEMAGNSGTISTQIMEGLKIQSLDKTENSNLDQASIGLTIFILIKIMLIGVTLWAFIQIFVLLITRLVAFFLLMALSPVGFVGNIIPKVAEYTKQWWETLTNQALVGPVFAFLFLLDLTLIKDGGLNSELGTALAKWGGSGSNSVLVGTILNVVILVGFLIATVKVTKKLSGELGSIATGLGSKALGFGLGLATGGGAMLGRNLIGRGMAKWAGSESLKRAAETSTFARLALRGADKVSKSSFDVKNTGLNKTINKKLGIDMGKGGGKDGFTGQVKRSTEKTQEMSKLLERDMTKGELDADGNLVSGGAGAKILEDTIREKNQERFASDEAMQQITGEISVEMKGLGALNKNGAYLESRLKDKNITKEEKVRVEGEREKNLEKIKEKEKKIKEIQEKRKAREKELELKKEEKAVIETEIKTGHQAAHATSLSKSVIGKITRGTKGNRAVVDKIRKDIKAKSNEEQLAELAVKVEKERKEKEEATKATTAPAPETTPKV
ncbi:MAG: hypothetical protein WC229_03185 [Candidatus Paceibacterota bacterium]|jgi:hypothetical protein